MHCSWRLEGKLITYHYVLTGRIYSYVYRYSALDTVLYQYHTIQYGYIAAGIPKTQRMVWGVNCYSVSN